MNALKTIQPIIRPYRWHFAIGIVLVLLANWLAVQVPVIVGDVVNLAEARRVSGDELTFFALYIVVIAALGGCFRFLMRRVLIDASRELEFNLRNVFFKKLQSLDPAFYDARTTGDLMSRGTNDMEAVRQFIGPAIMYAANTVFAVPLVLGKMIYLDWRLALLSLVPMTLLPPLVLMFGRATHARSKEQQEEFGRLSTMVQENFSGIRVVKAYCQESSQTTKFEHRNTEYIRVSLRLAWLQAFFFPAIRMLIGTGVVVILVVGGRHVIEGRLQVGTLMTFFLLFGTIVWPMIAAGWVIALMQRGVASLERINEVLRAEPLVKAPDAPRALPVRPDIEFRNLTFAYPGAASPQLRDVSLKVPFGTSVGIIGPVGCGKSTLVALLGRLYPVERGQLYIGGEDANDLDPLEVRGAISYVFQEPFLFSDTIDNNIRFGRVAGIDEGQVRAAASSARVAADIERFPRAYETELGERGINLSGGQKQRVAIARALVREAPILVLDDALSAVDTHTEEEILAELRARLGRQTVFLISHRVSTVAIADQVAVIEDGRITQLGTHEQLLAQPGLYAELHRRQLLEEEEERMASEVAGA